MHYPSSPWSLFLSDTQCGQPEVPENGHVIFHSSGPLVAGAAVSYKCDVGFILVGPEQRVCESNGVWSEHAPVCGKGILWVFDSVGAYTSVKKRGFVRG